MSRRINELLLISVADANKESERRIREKLDQVETSVSFAPKSHS